MINSMVAEADADLCAEVPSVAAVTAGDDRALARAISMIEAGRVPQAWLDELRGRRPQHQDWSRARDHRHRWVGQVVADR